MQRASWRDQIIKVVVVVVVAQGSGVGEEVGLWQNEPQTFAQLCHVAQEGYALFFRFFHVHFFKQAAKY